jgi:hypothetical protein
VGLFADCFCDLREVLAGGNAVSERLYLLRRPMWHLGLSHMRSAMPDIAYGAFRHAELGCELALGLESSGFSDRLNLLGNKTAYIATAMANQGAVLTAIF